MDPYTLVGLLTVTAAELRSVCPQWWTPLFVHSGDSQRLLHTLENYTPGLFPEHLHIITDNLHTALSVSTANKLS